MARTATAALALDAPMGEMNTTPLIDVMLVLLVMFILAVPAAVNQVPIDLPAPPATLHPPVIQPEKNLLSITPAGAVIWNGQPVTEGQLAWLLHETLRIKPEPELQFEPDPAAPYDTAAKVLNVVKRSGVSAFGFVGNDRFTRFAKAPVR